MAVWRIKLRDGKGGRDMWPDCRDHNVAAITYHGITNVDLRPYSKTSHPPGWHEVESKGSLNHFVWDMRGGDTIYVGDSRSHSIVGAGKAVAEPGELAYYFDPESPIATKSERWCHLIDVDWDETFRPFSYRDPAALITVLELKPAEIESYPSPFGSEEHPNQPAAMDVPLLADTAYARYNPAQLRFIARNHVKLSNEFRSWIHQQFGITVVQERSQIDATFETRAGRFLVEFKIAYRRDTKRAIREALGQIFEYNFYPPRICRDHWLLILDEAPNREDKAYMSALVGKFELPLNLGWREGSEFQFLEPLRI